MFFFLSLNANANTTIDLLLDVNKKFGEIGAVLFCPPGQHFFSLRGAELLKPLDEFLYGKINSVWCAYASLQIKRYKVY